MKTVSWEKYMDNSVLENARLWLLNVLMKSSKVFISNPFCITLKEMDAWGATESKDLCVLLERLSQPTEVFGEKGGERE